MKLYSVKQYAGTTFKGDSETNAEIIEGSTSELCKELKNNKSYHLRINAQLPCIAFGDFDHSPSEELFKDFLDVVASEFDVKVETIAYSLSVKQNEYSYHWSVNTIETNCSFLKQLMQNDEFTSYKTQIDLTVYSNKWFRLPNQTNKDKPFEHKIINGKMKDFLIHRIKSTTCKVEHKEETNKQIDFIDDDEKPKTLMNEPKPKPVIKDDNIISNIRNKVKKMPNYFDKYDEWTKLGFIIYNETNGSEEGKNLFDELSKLYAKYDGEKTTKQWYSKLKSSDKKLGIKTLNTWYYKMNPNENNVYDKDDYIEQKKLFEQRIFKIDKPFNYIKTDNSSDMEFLDIKTLKNWAKGEYKKIKTMDAQGNESLTNFTDLWEEDPFKRKYDNIIFDPKN